MPSDDKSGGAVFLRDGLLCDIDSVCGGGGAAVALDDEDLAMPVPERLPVDDDDEKEKFVVDEDPGEIGKDAWCTQSSYGGASSFDEKELEESIGPDEEGGLVWTVELVAEGTPTKPRRGMPFPVVAGDFLSSVRRIGMPNTKAHVDAGYEDLWDRDGRQDSLPGEVDHPKARWIFRGVLNGWPGMTLLEVRKVRIQEGRGTIFEKMWSHAKTSGKGKKIWDCDMDGNERGVDLSDAINRYSGEKKSCLVVELRAPSWTSQGWSSQSPGFVFWAEGPTIKDRSHPLTVNYGTNIIKNKVEEGDPFCTKVHMINHRYASPNKSESAKDRLSYHSFVLLEWDHKQYCSVVEIGYLNGIGGYRGQSNWLEDKDVKPYNRMYAALPIEMVLPWKSTLSEIRITNVPYKDKDDFVDKFMNKHIGHQGRFVDPNCSFSHEVRLTYNSRSNIATYLVNYILRDKTYSEMRRNCQTFAADVCGFLAGKRNVSPYHPVNQIQYTNSTHTFLYESSKYSKKK